MRCNRNTGRLWLTKRLLGSYARWGLRLRLALLRLGKAPPKHLLLKNILQGSWLFRRELLRFLLDFIKLQSCEYFF